VSEAEAAAGDRVRGEVVAVVYDAHLRQLRKTEQWCACDRERNAAVACRDTSHRRGASRALLPRAQASPALATQARGL
jgi:hypothetical protein